MDTSEVMGMIALIVSVGGAIIGIINRKRIRSNCCGHKLEASFQVDQIPPTPPDIKIPVSQDK